MVLKWLSDVRIVCMHVWCPQDGSSRSSSSNMLASASSSTSLAPFALEEEEEAHQPSSGSQDDDQCPGGGSGSRGSPEEDDDDDDDDDDEEVETDQVKPRAASQAWPIPSSGPNEQATVTTDAWVAASAASHSPTASSSLDTVGSDTESLRMVMSLPALSSSGGSNYQHFPISSQQQKHYTPFGASPGSQAGGNFFSSSAGARTPHAGFSPSSLPGSLGTTATPSSAALFRTSSGSNLSSLSSGGANAGSSASNSCPVLQILTNNHFVPTQVEWGR